MTASKSLHQEVIVNSDEEHSAIQKAMERTRSYVLTRSPLFSSRKSRSQKNRDREGALHEKKPALGLNG